MGIGLVEKIQCLYGTLDQKAQVCEFVFFFFLILELSKGIAIEDWVTRVWSWLGRVCYLRWGCRGVWEFRGLEVTGLIL